METQVPDTFDELDDAALEALIAKLTAEFDAKYDSETPASVEVLAEIAAALDNVRAEISRRSDEAAEDAARRDEIAQRVRPIAEADPEPVTPDEPADPAPVTPEAVEPVLEPVTAATRPVAPSASATARRATVPSAPPAEARDLVTITAAADIPGFSSGQRIDRAGVATAMHARARGLVNGSPRLGVASVDTNIPEHLKITHDGQSADDVMQQAVESVLAGKDAAALVASGGWCAPSETLYDAFSIESRDGLLDLPSIGVTRGGVSFPTYMGIDVAQGALWTWTETNDLNTSPRTITNVALTSNVATVTTAAPHGYVVGQTVQVDSSNDTFDGTYVVTSVPSTTTFTYARVAANVVSVAATGSVGSVKGCLKIPCPTWTDVRLGAEGLCVTHGNLSDRAYPEGTARFVDLVMTAHLHRMSAAQIARIVSDADLVAYNGARSDAAGNILDAIDLQVADYRSEHLMGLNTVLEAIFPTWVFGAIRATLAMRAGIEALDVSDAEVRGFFTARNLRPQFVTTYQPLYVTAPATVWPTTLKFIIFPAGGIVVADGGSIDLGVVRDSTLNATNDFTAAWSEQFYAVIRRGPQAREVTLTLRVTGITGGPAAMPIAA